MSKRLQIEQALLRLNQATFQKLCVAYFDYEYPEYKVKEIGGSRGQDTTTTGSPDILIDCKNGKYLFVECTIQKDAKKGKFLGDVKNCFDPNKTGIVVDDIELIILCHNGKELSKKNQTPIINEITDHGCNYQFIDIDTLTSDLYTKYPRLAKDYLSIEVDTQQIVLLPDFIKEQERKATSLQNAFLGREYELEVIKNCLHTTKIVVLTGNAGAGKTRLAIEVFRQIKQDKPDFEIYGIENKGIPLWNDLQVYFLPDQKYLLIVDDANRISEFQHIARLALTEQFEIYIIVTVRDYAIEKVLRILEEQKYSYQKVEIKKLSDDAVRKILISLKITNSICVDKITSIADGNPRLVLMASDFALKDNDCRKLDNVVSIYDEYFSKVLTEVTALNNESVLKTLGIICFFRTISKEDQDLNNQIFFSFQISDHEFWESVIMLHQIEVVDLYEKEVVKISDQTVATYFFYYIFIKRQLLDYSIILNVFLDGFPGKVKESLFPVLNHLDYKSVMQVLDEKINQKLKNSYNDLNSLIGFFKVFWFCRQDELLNWLQEKITDMEVDTTSEYDFTAPERNEYLYEDDEYFELLKLFENDAGESYILSLEILFLYLQKKPSLTRKVVKYFTHDLSFDMESHRHNYKDQNDLFDFLFRKLQEENSYLAKRLILAIAEHFLKLEYQSTRSGRQKTVTISQIYLLNCEAIRNLRERLWSILLHEYSNFETIIFEIFSKYLQQTQYAVFHFKDNETAIREVVGVIVFEENFIFRFFDECLDGSKYIQCKLFHDHLNNCSKEMKMRLEAIKNKFTTKTYNIEQLLDWDYRQLRKGDRKLSLDEFQQQKIKKLHEAFQYSKLDDYFALLSLIEQSSSFEPTNHYGLQKRLSSLEIILIELANKNIRFCIQVLDHLFEKGNTLRFSSGLLTEKILTLLNHVEFYKVITKHEYSLRSLWCLHYFAYLNKDVIDNEAANKLINCYNGLESNLRLNFSFLEKYKNVRPSVTVDVIKILLEKVKSDEFTFFSFEFDFFEKYASEFICDLDVIKQFYFFLQAQESHFDSEGSAIEKIVHLDKNFIIEYINAITKGRYWYSKSESHPSFSFLWKMKDVESWIEEFFDKLIDTINIHSYLSILFPDPSDNRAVEFIKRYIQKNATHPKRMRAIFEIITDSFYEQRTLFLKELFIYNQNIEFIQKLTLIPTSRTASSFVPVYQSDKEFWKEVENLCLGNLKLLKVKLWAKEEQKYCDKRIENELKREFTSDY